MRSQPLRSRPSFIVSVTSSVGVNAYFGYDETPAHPTGVARSVMTKNLATADLDWSDLRRGRSRHWLLRDEWSEYFETLLWEQAASQDGSAEGTVRWYDHAGKTVPEVAGTESYPAVEAQMMPDETTWYRETTRNSLGKPLSITERWGQGGSYPSRTETFTYAGNGIDLLIHANALGIAELKLGYDSHHRVIARTNALGEIDRFGYDANGRMIGHTNAVDWRLVRTFSTDGLAVTNIAYLISTSYRTNIDALYLNQSYTRTNLNGGNLTYATRQVVETDERGLVTTNIFDPLGRIWERRQTGGLRDLWHYELHPSESFATGSGGTLLLDLTARVNALGQMQRLAYDGLRRLAQTIDTRGTTNRMTYCDCGRPATVEEAYGTAIARTTSHEYDFQGKHWKTTTAQGSMSTNYYDALGRLTNRFSRTSNPGTNCYNTTYAYDKGGSLTNASSPGYSGNVARSYAYDALAGLTSMVDAVGTTGYSYGLPGNGLETVAKDGPWSSDTVTVTNLHGLRSALLVAQPTSSFTRTYGWDASRRMTHVTGGGQTFAYIYPGAGQLIGRISLPGGPYWITTIKNTHPVAQARPNRVTHACRRDTVVTPKGLNMAVRDTCIPGHRANAPLASAGWRP